jgi:hypothetical protein
MQIHELTQKKPRVDEAFADVVRGASSAVSKVGQVVSKPKQGLSNIKAAWQQGKVASQTRKLADQSQAAWNRYVQNWEATMDPDEKAKFATRKQDGGLYKRQLTAWVQKNMLSGLTLANVTNRNEILATIDALSQARQISPVKEAAVITDPVARAKAEKMYQAQQAAKGAAAEPAKPTPAPDATPPSTPGLTPSEEKRLWLKLAQQVGRAQMAAYTGEREASDDADATNIPAQTKTAPQGDARPVLQQALGDQAKNMGSIGAVVQQQAVTSSVKSTGNAVVDAALRLMGFTVS